MLAYWKKLEKTQYFSLNELQEIQWQRLEKIYSFLWKYNSFYRCRFQNAGLSPDSLKEPADITKLPILTKKEIRENSNLIISEGFEKNSLLHFKTGGSTGKALDIFITEGCSELRNACARRHNRWTGWQPGEPIGAVWGNPKLPKTLRDKLKASLLTPYTYLDTMAVNDQAVYEFARQWKKMRPKLLYGHAHSLFILAKYVDKLGIDDIRPGGILSTSMMLLQHERASIERVFQCKVTDRYGCEEVSLIGSECERHEGMHLNIEHLVTEFIKPDGSSASPGEQGNIVLTDLMNYSMPFIRYRVEDVGISKDIKCSCGRGLPLMKKVTGRVADFLLKKSGDRVAGVSLIENTLTDISGINQMQIVQNSLDSIVLNIVPGKTYNESADQLLREYFRKIFPEAQLAINLTNEIAPEESGKYRFSICKISEMI